jgi:hypothetical protein
MLRAIREWVLERAAGIEPASEAWECVVYSNIFNSLGASILRLFSSSTGIERADLAIRPFDYCVTGSEGGGRFLV